MPVYHLNFVCELTGRVAHRYEFASRDDAAAERFARVWSEDAPMELWRGPVKLRRWDRRKCA